MIIDTSKLHELWYENDKGEKFIPDLTGNMPPEPPKGFIYIHSRFPTILHTNINYMVEKNKVAACPHKKDHVISTYGWIDGIEGRECRYCKGTQVKGVHYPRPWFWPARFPWFHKPWPKKWDAYGSRPLMDFENGYPEDVVIHLLGKGYSLSHAILIAATACERCINVLTNEINPENGYLEYSNEWKKAKTTCQFCEHDGTDHVIDPDPIEIDPDEEDYKKRKCRIL